MILVTMISCDKEGRIPSIDKELPTITTEGKNTFGCLKNGEVWTPYLPLGLFPPGAPRLTASYYKIGGGLEICAQRVISDKNVKNWLCLYSDSIFGEGNFKLIANLPLYNVDKTYFEDNVNNKIYSLVSSSDSKLEIIHFDTINHIVSGTFNMVLVDSLALDSIFITQGRFDVKL